MIRTIGLAIAFSPTAGRLLAEAGSMARQFHSRLIVIHIGDHGPKEDQLMEALLASGGLTRDHVKVCWGQGDPATAILGICDSEKVDLLIAGALKKENLLHYYLGTIARNIMRKSKCSVLLLTEPSLEPKGFSHIVVDAEDSQGVETSLTWACRFGKKENNSWIHVVRELQMFGLAMSSADQCSEDEYDQLRQGLLKDEIKKVESMLLQIPHGHLKVNIKVVTGKSGFELAQFARKKHADLLVVSAPARRFRFFDRVFTHDLEYVFADLPSNLLIVQPGKEEFHG